MKQAIQIIRTCNPDPGTDLGFIERWLVITRACVFSMTILSALIGALLAAYAATFDWKAFVLVVVGLILAHASNNMVNDYFDVRHGVDTPDYPRANYAPHPILSGLITIRGLWIAVAAFNAVEFAIALILTYWKGWPIMAFACLGLAFSVLYVAPPLKLKHRGLGEAAIFLIWGPLMIAGTYYAVSGSLPGWVWAASLPYGMAVTAVVLGKHLDKHDRDAQKGVRTLPVLLGPSAAKTFMAGLMIGSVALSACLVLLGLLPWPALLVLLSIPATARAMKVVRQPMPATPREAFDAARDCIPRDLRDKFDPARDGAATPLWPLWYVVWGVWWARIMGSTLVLGLVVGLLLG